MGGETAAQITTDVSKPTEESAQSGDAVPQPAVVEADPVEGAVVATDGVAEVPMNGGTQKEPNAHDQVTANAQPVAETAGHDAATSAGATATNGTTEGDKPTNGRRKSGAGVAEHKKKTPTKGKKKVPPELRLNVSAGEMYMVAMRGYQPWPVIVCDEDMLPESLISKRPVSAKRIDGTYREDFLEGGKNAKDRRYPIMFLGTNEFAWQVNTELLPFDLDDVKRDVESGHQGKKNKALWEAYKVAAEGHDLDHFKDMLAEHERALWKDAKQREQKVQEKKEKAEKASKRKSIAAAESDDVDMGDVDDTAPKKGKASKKRKKDDESDIETEKPAKTPKTKLKLTTKTPKDTSTPKSKKESKTKKKTSEEAEAAQDEGPPLTEEERLQKREKHVLYLRHRLQKGFLSRDQAPKDDDMSNMSLYLKELEAHEDLEAEIIKRTKVHKVLKAIIKLDSIPKEEQFHFKSRSNELLTKWSGALAADTESAVANSATVEPATNGVKHEDVGKQPTEAAKDEVVVEEKGNAPSKVAEVKSTDTDGDVVMANTDQQENKDAVAIKAAHDSGAEPVAGLAKSAETVVAASGNAAE